MSKYYKIAGLKVRVSDHEPNERLNGSNDIELYTVDACNNRLSIEGQLERICEVRGLDIALFADILSDFPEPEYIDTTIQKIIVSAEFLRAYRAISGKGVLRRQKALSEKFGYNWYMVSQRLYTTEKNINNI